MRDFESPSSAPGRFIDPYSVPPPHRLFRTKCPTHIVHVQHDTDLTSLNFTAAASVETCASALFRHVRPASDAFRCAVSMHYRLRHDRSVNAAIIARITEAALIPSS
nr:uncharacterized protein CTRU02_11717 [Colletotrichum truncatum]KAF6785416.1 hypothetical protein CTRU02_11717 [Colletotrichum truncatum]